MQSTTKQIKKKNTLHFFYQKFICTLLNIPLTNQWTNTDTHVLNPALNGSKLLASRFYRLITRDSFKAHIASFDAAVNMEIYVLGGNRNQILITSRRLQAALPPNVAISWNITWVWFCLQHATYAAVEKRSYCVWIIIAVHSPFTYGERTDGLTDCRSSRQRVGR